MNSSTPNTDTDLLKKWIPQMLRDGQAVWINADGYSMYPSLRPGDKLKVIPFDFQSIVVGDVIAFLQKDIFVAHRVIEIDSGREDTILKAKGDSVFVIDESVTPTNFLGKIVELKRKDKTRLVYSKPKNSKWITRYCWMRKILKAYRLAIIKRITFSSGSTN